MYELKGEDLSKRFGELKVFSKLNFDLHTGESMAVIGPNGSGKSTLMMVLLSIYRPSKGKIAYLLDGKEMEENQIRASVSLVSPYLNLYDQLSGEENLKFFATVAGENITGKEIENLLEKVGLAGRGMDLVGGYSSGMKQRLKYATALLNKPAFLYLDEPTSNLDAAGKKIVADLIEEYRSQSIIVIATNEEEEYHLATKQLRVDK